MHYIHLVKKLWQSGTIFFTLLLAITLLLFHTSFSVGFILDDFWFLKVGRADSIGEFLHFFTPGKVYFYRPLPTEFFYFIIHLLNENVYLTHGIIWIVYFVGIFFLYQSALHIIRHKNIARLFVFMYSIHFTHIFQLYHIATVIEVALFTFLVLSFYYFLKKKRKLSFVFFTLALLSKETAVLFPIFLYLFMFVQKPSFSLAHNIKRMKPILMYILLAGLALLLYKSSVAQVAQDEITYSPQWTNLGLIINNIVWYGFWGIGFPNYLPNYLPSILGLPSEAFWEELQNPDFLFHFIYLWVYLVLFILSTAILFIGKKLRLKNKISTSLLILISGLWFLLFISPTIFILHKWMVRLTVPLIFLVFAQSYVLYLLWNQGRLLRFFSGVLVVLYILMNFFGIKTHETSSLFLLQSQYYNTTKEYISYHRQTITTYYDSIYISYQEQEPNAWSDMLEITFHGQDILDHLLPQENMYIIYGYKTKDIPPNSYIIPASHLLRE